MALYCYSVDGQKFTGKFETIEDARRVCIEENALINGAVYHIGEVKEYSPREFMAVLDIPLKMNQQAKFQITEDMSKEFNLEVSKAYAEEVVGMWPETSHSKYHDLREMLAKFFEQYYPADFFSVSNVKSFIAGE